MTKVIIDLTMSLDGFIAGPGVSKEKPMGEGGEKLHRWFFQPQSGMNLEVLKTVVDSSGAVIVGNHTYDTAIDDAWGGKTPFSAPAFVMCHQKPEKPVSGFTYISTGIEDGYLKAMKAAGDKNVWVMGGAVVINQFLKAGYVDIVTIHIAPILLGSGTRLFEGNGTPMELKKVNAIEAPDVTHLFFEVIKN